MDGRKPDDDEATQKKNRRNDTPPAGPHARPELINPDLTPGSGVLPSEDDETRPPTG